MSGGYNYADAYSKYKQGVSPDSDFEKYVDSQGDLKNAWSLISDYQAGKRGADLAKYVPLITQNGLSPEQQADYWIKRGVTSKAAFGRAHAAEDESLRSGTYQGGTEVKPWKGDTRFEKWDKGKDKKVVDKPPTGPIKHDNKYFPMLTQDYSSPASQDWSAYMGGGNPALTGITEANPAGNKGLLYQPWTSDYQTAAGIPNNLWNYAPPEGIDYAVRYTNPLTGKLDMNLMPAGSATTGGGTTTGGTTTGGTTGVRPGSDKAKDLAAGRTHHPEMYDEDGNWIGAEGNGDRSRDFAAEAHEAMYPGSQQMASNSGFGLLTANRFNPAYRDYRQNNINQMISMGVLPAGSKSYKSQNWRDWMDVLGGGVEGGGETEAETDAADIEAMAGGGHGVVG